MLTSKQPTKPGRSRLLGTLLLVIVAALWAVHWPHLQADFPNNSPWMDYAKYTDEGWYGNAAIRAHLFGHWFLPGDFNPAVALPVWPLLEWLLFSLTGVTPVAARGLALVIFGGNLLLSYNLLRAAGAHPLARAAGVLLLAGSMFLWAFSRLAILEPLLTFWTLAAWLLALRLREFKGRRRILALAAVGLLSCLAVLTKTTALFLLPATAAILAWSAGWRLRRLPRELGTALAGGGLPWLAYFLLFARPRDLDFHYLFTANRWMRPKGLHDQLLAFWWAAHGLLWVGPALVCVMLVLLVLAAAFSRAFRSAPLVHASLLAAAGYIFFTGWHNSPQPRYYMVLVYPVVFVTVLAVQAIRQKNRILAALAGASLLVIFVRDLNASLWYARHPEYTLLRAAQGLTAYIDQHPADGRRMLLSISGDEITLLTHLPAICDDYGTDDLETRIERYRPGWYAQWNELDPGTLEDIHAAGYRLQAVAHWHAFDDEDRDDLILYQMVPLTAAERTALGVEAEVDPNAH